MYVYIYIYVCMYIYIYIYIVHMYLITGRKNLQVEVSLDNYTAWVNKVASVNV